MKTRPDSRRSRSRVLRRGTRAGRGAGYALVVVIWGLGIISLMIVSFMTTARMRLQAANNIAGATQADEIAQAAINLAILSLAKERQAVAQAPVQPTGALPVPTAAPQRIIHAGEPSFCGISGAAVALAVEDEGGKVDLNGANQALMKAMLIGFGLGQNDADSAAGAIVAFRSGSGDPGNASALPGKIGGRQSKQELFQTVYELDQVEGFDPSLVRQIIPFVTVHGRRPRVDAETAPPALFGALIGLKPEEVQTLRATPYPNDLDRQDPRFPAAYKQNGDSGIYLIHAESRLGMGQTAVREAIVDLNGDNGALFAIREVRRGELRFLEVLRAAQAQGGLASPC
ncbi:general secretion pathway protein GspK [Methylocystis heyeri]|nr:type II secretion system protein GspK [Methylocystis heyeri]